MRKIVKIFTAFVLVFALMVPLAVGASWEEYGVDEAYLPEEVVAEVEGHPGIRIVGDEIFVWVRYLANEMGVQAEWDDELELVILTNLVDEMFIFNVEASGGFVEDGMAWIPAGFANELMIMLFVQEVAERVERIDLTIWNEENFLDVREPMFSTDLGHGEIAVGFIHHMSEELGLRTPFTYKELEAAIWIVDELLAMGHDFANIEIQEFTYWDFEEVELGLMPLMWELVTSPMILGTGRDNLIRQDRVSQNVVLTIPGRSSQTIIVGAHYDTVPYPGASDNASGVALLLESAQRMLEIDNYYTIVYVFFGAEEVGLIGAYFFYHLLSPAQRDNIVLMVNADVLIEGPYIIFGAGAIPEVTEAIVDEAMEYFANYLRNFLAEHLDALIEDFIEMGLAPEDLTDEFFEGLLEMNLEALGELGDSVILSQAFQMGLIEPHIDDRARQINEIAANLNDELDLGLISRPMAIAVSSDNLVFLFEGHTIVSLVGFERRENVETYFMAFDDEFVLTVLHSEDDEFYYIEARWPGMMQSNLRAFGLFLEAILTMGL